MNDNWLTSDKVLLAGLVVFFALIWLWTRSDGIFRMIDFFSGALVGLVTGKLIAHTETK